jgi:hypothetical protein
MKQKWIDVTQARHVATVSLNRTGVTPFAKAEY